MDTKASLHELVDKLDNILNQVRSPQTPLEKSLDLLDEAVTVGLEAVKKVDIEPLSPSESLKSEPCHDNMASQEDRDLQETVEIV
ncbi:MAG: exodeoxyribonuclease VII small subunit [Coriobacteriales bacterium]|nr:exodeoxyribonuclease VII small subunit [Coriobacteriales bacterium]